MVDPVCLDQEQLRQFNDGTLSPAAAERAAAHLDDCQACCDSLDSLGSSPIFTGAHEKAGKQYAFQQEAEFELLQQRLDALNSSITLGNKISHQAAVDSALSDLQNLREYRIIREIGRGGMGAVYLAHHTKLDRAVALKVLPISRVTDATGVARFEREIRAVGRLDHRNIVRALDAGEVGETHFLVMEYVDGVDLSRLLKLVGQLRIADACELVRQAALGIAEAGEHGMVHRDVKPSNLMVCQPKKREAPIVKVLDLGLAMLSPAHLPDQQAITTTGQAMGTIDYMAPEQGSDCKTVDIRADIYSLGATLYKLLTGVTVFHGEEHRSPVQKIMALATKDAKPIESIRSDVPPGLAVVVHRMLAKDRDARFHSPDDVVAALAPYCEGAHLADVLTEAHEAESRLEPRIDPAAKSGPTKSHSIAAKSTVNTQAQSSPDVPAQVRVGEAKRSRSRPFRSLLIVLGLFAVAASMVAGVVVFVQTPKGNIRVEIHDPKVEVQVSGESVILTQGDSKQISVTPGDKTLLVTRDDLEFRTDSFTVRRGDDAVIRVSIVEGNVQVAHNGKIIADERMTDQVPPPIEQIASNQPRLDVTPTNTPEAESYVASGKQWHGWPAAAPTAAIAPFTTEEAAEHQRAWASFLKVPIEYVNSIGMKFRLIPPGEFRMGNSSEFVEELVAQGMRHDELASTTPQHHVTLTKPLYLSIYEATQGQFNKVVGNIEAKQFIDNRNYPLTGVGFIGMATFCNNLSERENLTARYDLAKIGSVTKQSNGYRLPTEAEWEFALLAGKDNALSFDGEYAEFARVDYNSEVEGTSYERPTAVGTLLPNPFGLFDMHGNVIETCEDFYEANHYQQYASREAIDPAGPASGEFHVIRGGHFAGNVWENTMRRGGVGQGFRVALSVQAVKQALSADN